MQSAPIVNDQLVKRHTLASSCVSTGTVPDSRLLQLTGHTQSRHAGCTSLSVPAAHGFQERLPNNTKASLKSSKLLVAIENKHNGTQTIKCQSLQSLRIMFVILDILCDHDHLSYIA